MSMALSSMQCRGLQPFKASMAPRASTRSTKLLCRAEVSHTEPGTTRRQSLGLLLSLPVLLSGSVANAVELGDFRKVKESLDSLDQARSDTEDYKNRFSMQGGSSNLTIDEHKSRAKESFARLQTDVKKAIDSKSYLKVSADLRHQLGTLSFDLNKVAQATGDKATRKQSQQVQKAVKDALAELDFAARKKNDNSLQQAYAEAVQAVGTAISSLG